MLQSFSSSIQGLFIGLTLALNDVISFGITKEVFLKNKLSLHWLIIPVILYGLQILLFYYGLGKTSMSVLNITWNLVSNVLVTLVGLYYFKEQITNLKYIALLLAFASIGLFAVDGIQNP